MRRLVALLAAALLSACAKPDPNVTVLTYASPYPSTHPFSQADIIWMKWVEAQTHGHVRIKPYWGGALLSSNDNMVEIRHGVADIGLVTPMYARSAHIQRVQSGFYSGVGSIQQQIDVYRCLANEFPQMNGEIAGLHVLAVQGGGFPGILTRNRPIRTLADLKGLRLRAQADTAPVLRQLGADPINMSMAEVYPAMAKGVIDGVVAPPDSLKAMHLADVGRYFSTLKVPRGAYPGRAISDQAWKRLSLADRIVLANGERVWEGAMVQLFEKAVVDGTNYAKAEGVQSIAPAPGEQQKFEELYRVNAARTAARLAAYGVNGTAIANRATALLGPDKAQCPTGDAQ